MSEQLTAQQLHARGLIAYNNKEWDVAAFMHSDAIEQAWIENDERLVAIAHRDLSAALVQGDGGLTNAKHAAETSVDMFERIGDERELGASYDAEARVYLRAAMQSETQTTAENTASTRQLGNIALQSAHKAGELLGGLHGKPDQYYVNSIRRETAVEGLYGSKWRAFKLGVKVVGISLLSQSPTFIANTEMSKSKAEKAKVKVRQVGSVAILFAAGAADAAGQRRKALSLVQKSRV